MASKKKKITLSHLLAEKEEWGLAYESQKYQYYLHHPAPGIWGEIRKIKTSIVMNYLNQEKGQ